MSRLPTVDYEAKNDRYTITGSFAGSTLISQLGAAWNASRSCWTLRAAPGKLLDLRGHTNVSYTDAATKHIYQELGREDALRQLRTAGDATVLYGDGIDPYQRVGVQFMAEAGRAILADFPGAGKTAQAVRAACEVGAGRVLVVTRKSLIYNWLRQIALWKPAECRVLFDVTNYEQVTRHPEKFESAPHYNVLIVDEQQAIKNRKAQRSKAVYRVAQRIPYVWMLTGTLITNRPDELWMPLHILYPQRYRSFWRFVEEYCEIEINPFSGGRQVAGLKQGSKDALADELAPIVLRRDRDVVDLPPITRETIWVSMGAKQERAYRSMKEEFFMQLDSGGLLHAPSVIAQLVRLRQLSCNPALVGGVDVSAKTEALLDLVEDYAPGYKLLVFTTFARYAEDLHRRLAAYGSVLITGDVSAKQRDNAVEALNNNPACRVLVGTYGAVGEGLNIQGADVVVLADKPWVPSAVEQAESRAHRRGRKGGVHVISLLASETVDEYIESVLDDKQATITELDMITRIIALMRREEGE